MAYNKQILENKQKLREFCKTRGSTLEAPNYYNYDILSNFENNNSKITELKNIVNELIKYEPNKEQILEQYPEIKL